MYLLFKDYFTIISNIYAIILAFTVSNLYKLRIIAELANIYRHIQFN